MLLYFLLDAAGNLDRVTTYDIRCLLSSKSFVLKKTRDRCRFVNEDKGASRGAILVRDS